MVQPWILIPTRNGKHWLEECLQTLRATVPGDVPIVVIDNASNDGTIEFLTSRHPSVRRLELSRNLGFVEASNLGILLARRGGADSVLLLNNDTRLAQGWYDHLVDAANNNPSIGIFGVAQSDFDGRPSRKTRVALADASDDPSQPRSPEVVSTDWVEGSCMLVRESVFQRIGYLDPIYAPAYFEEIDFCRRARAQGVGVALVASSRIQHFGAGTSRPSGRRWLRSRAERRRRVLSELNYLVFHASDPRNPSALATLVGRAARHGAKQLLARQLSPDEWLSASAAALRLLGAIRCKRLRDAQGRACPLVGSGLRGGAKHTHYLDWIALIDATPLFDVESPVPSDASQPIASVVIPVRDRTDDLERCLGRVLAQSLSAGEFEVLVCDDGSQPQVARRIEAICCRDDRVRYLWQEGKGPAAARNLGVRHARAAFVAFTDSDTLPQERWLENLLAPFADPNIVAVEGPVRTPGPARSPLEEAPRNEGGVHLTANMAYRRTTLIQVGGLDEKFSMPAFEDVDLALCASRLGRIAFANDAVVIHPWRRVTLASSLRRLRQLDLLIVTAQRHGCLGWRDRPTRHPRLRVIRAALVTMPIGRLRKSLAMLNRSPWDALTRIGITVAETAAALFHVPRWMRAKYAPLRKRYLHGAMR